MSEACRIIITQEASGLLNVSAPMKYKELCYDILDDAKRVIELTPEPHFFAPMAVPTLLITMNTSGLVDVQAPLPKRAWCEIALKGARRIIEEFDLGDDKMRRSGYADCIPAP